MKIILFTEVYDCGGVDTFIVNLINNYPDPEAEFVVIANNDYPGLSVIEQNVKRKSFKTERHGVYIYTTYAGCFLNKCSLPVKWVKRIFSPVARYLIMAYDVVKFRSLLFNHCADRLMVVNGGFPGGDSCRAASICWTLFGGKLVNNIHSFHSIVTKPRFPFFIQEMLLDLLLSGCVRAFVGVSRAAAASMRARPLISPDKVSYIHNGIEIPAQYAFSPPVDIKAEFGIPEGGKLCLMLGTYGTQKGHSFLFRVFTLVLNKIPSAHLLICGYGTPEEVNAVTGLVKACGLEANVHLSDFRQDVEGMLSKTDVLLVSSQSFEAFGFTSVEAMAMHVPVVATGVGGVPEVVEDGDGGYCLAPDDVQGYAGRIIELLSDDNLRVDQGKKGFARVHRLFTAGIMAGKYCEVLNGRGARERPHNIALS